MRRHHQERKLSMLRFWRDAAERQLAALNAAIQTLQAVSYTHLTLPTICSV